MGRRAQSRVPAQPSAEQIAAFLKGGGGHVAAQLARVPRRDLEQIARAKGVACKDGDTREEIAGRLVRQVGTQAAQAARAQAERSRSRSRLWTPGPTSAS